MPSSLSSPAPVSFSAAPAPLRTTTGPILVASDGEPDTDAALAIARLLAEQTGEALQIVAALEPLTYPMLGTDYLPAVTDLIGPQRMALRNGIHAQLQRLRMTAVDAPVSLLDGDPARVLAQAAHRQDARLLVLGRGRHGVLDRLLGGEIIIRLLQLADTPVYAAQAGTSTLPRRVLLATDFSANSIYAARVALSLADPQAKFYLACVAAKTASFDDDFARVQREIGAEQRQIQHVVLTGQPGRALVEFAANNKIDLVVSGTHGYGFFNRLILGSVATQLVHGTPCSVLIVPASAALRASAPVRWTSGRSRTIPAEDWPSDLQQFTLRNLGRQCTVEIDDCALGAQVAGQSIPLIGAAFDHHGNEVQLMFGARGLAGRYLTHVVPGVDEIDLLRDDDGRDRALRVCSGAGSTLLTFQD
jgi:nucleotide-binding universal stress UspA family protein